MSAFLFILSLEMLFVQVRENKNIEGLNSFGHEFNPTLDGGGANLPPPAGFLNIAQKPLGLAS